jgi:nitrite reductase/ring-hydroxylating ferredoxin subunit
MSDRQDDPACVGAAVPGFLEVGTLDQVPPGAALHVAVGEADLALVNMDGHVVAIGDLCLRCGDPLSTAALAGAHLTCSRCGWQYDVEQGCVVGLPELVIEKHEVRVDDGHLFVAVAALESPASMP